MTETNDNKENSNDANSESNDQDNQATGNSHNAGTEKQNVPLDKFLDQKKLNKQLKDQLLSFETRDKEAANAKLLEDKKYQELIQNKDKELSDYKDKLNQEITNNKLTSIKNNLSRQLDKVNAIDSNDALKFIDYNDLLESDDVEGEIKNRVAVLAESKSYLFKTGSTTRSATENGQPAGTNSTTNNVAGKVPVNRDPILASLTQKFK